jgi:Domain of unknown function (DUF4126)
VAGKIPYVDSAWDLVHTAVRPVLGGAIGVLMAQHAHGSLARAVAAAAPAAGRTASPRPAEAAGRQSASRCRK